MLRPLLLMLPLIVAAGPRNAEGLAGFLRAFAAKGLTQSKLEVLKAEMTAVARVPERAAESGQVVTFLYQVKNISRVYQLCVVEAERRGAVRFALGKPDYFCRDELLANFARFKAEGTAGQDVEQLQGLLWAENEPAVLELESELKAFWQAQPVPTP